MSWSSSSRLVTLAAEKKEKKLLFGEMEVKFSFSVAHKTTGSARFVIDGKHGKKMDALNKTHALQNWQQRHGGWWIASDYSSWWTISIRAACASSIPKPKRRRRMLTTDGNLRVLSSAAEIDGCDSDCVKVNHCCYFLFIFFGVKLRLRYLRFVVDLVEGWHSQKPVSFFLMQLTKSHSCQFPKGIVSDMNEKKRKHSYIRHRIHIWKRVRKSIIQKLNSSSP